MSDYLTTEELDALTRAQRFAEQRPEESGLILRLIAEVRARRRATELTVHVPGERFTPAALREMAQDVAITHSVYVADMLSQAANDAEALTHFVVLDVHG